MQKHTHTHTYPHKNKRGERRGKYTKYIDEKIDKSYFSLMKLEGCFLPFICDVFVNSSKFEKYYVYNKALIFNWMI